MNTVLPWDLNPALKRERLVTLARLVAETRNKVFAEADREAGDTNWGLACRAHERLGHALVRLAESGKLPWLTVSREGLFLMPRIEGVPIRAYRGAPDRPASRHLDALRAELERNPPKQTAFSFMEAADQDGPWFWLMALETDETGQIARVTYLQANDAHATRNAWGCPLDEPIEVPERKRAAPPKSATRAAKQPQPGVTMGGSPPYPPGQPVTMGGSPPYPPADALDFPLPLVQLGGEAPAALHAG